MNCTLDEHNRCTRCGAIARNPAARRNCAASRPGLGDRVAHALATVGVTKERANDVAVAIGLPGCGCDQRQETLNKVGKMFGIGN